MQSGPGPPEGRPRGPDDRLQRSLVEFAEAHCRGALVVALEASDPTKAYGIPISVETLLAHDRTACEALVRDPTATIDRLTRAVLEAQDRLYRAETADSSNSNACFDWSFKSQLRPRLRDFPNTKSKADFPAEVHRETVSSLRGRDKDALVCVHGKLMRVCEPLTVEWERGFHCDSKDCKFSFRLNADFDVNNEFIMPSVCPSNEKTGCTSTKFKPDKNSPVKFIDVQEVRLMDDASRLGMGTMPRSIQVVLLDDLIDCAKPGDDVMVVGVVRARWATSRPVVGRREDISLYLEANNVLRRAPRGAEAEAYTSNEAQRDFVRFWRRHAESPLAARNHLLRSVCPQLCDLEVEKLALLLTVAGGVERAATGGVGVRGSPHLLLVGEPGTGKSQLLKYALRLSHRAVLTSGIGSSAAGLTAAVVRDDRGRASLEAGALVLADGGVCCIDEFGAIKGDGEKSLLEAMEQQTISLAKAGITRTLPARTSVVAAMNPRGAGWNVSKSLAANTRLGGPLLSRFDLILVLQDPSDPAVDARRAAFTLAQHAAHDSRLGASAAAPEAGSSALGPGLPGEELWGAARLRAYLQFARRSVRPVCIAGDGACTQAERLLQWYWQRIRAVESAMPGDEARATPRLLESLVRLAEAHARLMLRRRVLATDAAVSIGLHELGRGEEPPQFYLELAALCPGPDALQRERVRTLWEKLQRVVRSGPPEPFDDTLADAAEAEGVDPAAVASLRVRTTGGAGGAFVLEDPPWPPRFFRCRPQPPEAPTAVPVPEPSARREPEGASAPPAAAEEAEARPAKRLRPGAGEGPEPPAAPPAAPATQVVPSPLPPSSAAPHNPFAAPVRPARPAPPPTAPAGPPAFPPPTAVARPSALPAASPVQPAARFVPPAAPSARGAPIAAPKLPPAANPFARPSWALPAAPAAQPPNPFARPTASSSAPTALTPSARPAAAAAAASTKPFARPVPRAAASVAAPPNPFAPPFRATPNPPLRPAAPAVGPPPASFAFPAWPPPPPRPPPLAPTAPPAPAVPAPFAAPDDFDAGFEFSQLAPARAPRGPPASAPSAPLDPPSAPLAARPAPPAPPPLPAPPQPTPPAELPPQPPPDADFEFSPSPFVALGCSQRSGAPPFAAFLAAASRGRGGPPPSSQRGPGGPSSPK